LGVDTSRRCTDCRQTRHLWDYLIHMTNHRRGYLLRATMLSVAFLLPSLPMGEGLPAVRGEQVLVAGYAVSLLVGMLLRRRSPGIPKRVLGIALGGVAFSGAIAVSLLHASLALAIIPAMSDWFEFARVVEYMLLIFLGASFEWRGEDIAKYESLVLRVGAISALVGLAQWVDLFRINEWLAPLYVSTQLAGLQQSHRIVGMLANPNEFGASMSLILCLAVSRAIWAGNRSQLRRTVTLIMLIGLALASSQSRGALVAASAGVMGVLLLSWPRLRGKKYSRIKRLLPWFLISCLLIALFFVTPPEYLGRFGQLRSIDTASSWIGRLNAWSVTTQQYSASPVFGLGPGKRVDTRIYVDNEWLMLARQYGAVGLAVFLVWVLALSRALVHSPTAAGDDVHYSIAARASLLGIGVYMISAAFYESYQLMGIFLLTMLPLFRGPVKFPVDVT